MDRNLDGFARALEVMARLRAPGGCPWDREQDHDTLKPYLVEEAYEVLEAIDSPERDVPAYLDVDHRKMQGTFIRVPEFAEVPYPVAMEPNLVIEYYSKH